MTRAYRNYKGVKIFRERVLVPGSDFDISKTGSVVNRKPEYDVYYYYAGGPRCDSLNECNRDIDDLLTAAESFDAADIMKRTLNTG